MKRAPPDGGRVPIHRVVDAEDEGERADVVLGRRVPGVSRRVARRMGLEGRLFVDGHRRPPSYRVRAGSSLELRVAAPSTPPAPSILRVTPRLVYVDKPAGMHTHRLRPDDPPALADSVVHVHPECARASADPREGGALHRLDRETTGVVAFARDREVWEAGRAAFSSGTVHKTYEAICAARSWPPSPAAALAPGSSDDLGAFDIRAPLGTGHGAGNAMVRPDGQPAHTEVRILAHATGPEQLAGGVGPHRVLCRFVLRTGRRHQARVHAAYAGLPIVGDTLYGGPPGEHGLMLHAAAIDFGLAWPGEPAEPGGPSEPGERPVQAPRPVGFMNTLAALGLSA